MKAKLTLIAMLLSLAGIICSLLLGPGTVAPRATILTCIAALLFIVFQYLYLRTRFGWGRVKTIIVQLITCMFQLIIIFVLCFLWFVVLPVIAIIVIAAAVRKPKAATPYPLGKKN